MNRALILSLGLIGSVVMTIVILALAAIINYK